MYQPYDQALKANARKLRKTMTREEVKLWQHLRKRQILGIKFLRQKPLYGYVLDFYSPEIKLAIELDGGQHFEERHAQDDKLRDINLSRHGIQVIRYTNLDINHSMNEVLEDIYNRVRMSV